jgi:glycosyltransferase involved in cell wall biosynthesis
MDDMPEANQETAYVLLTAAFNEEAYIEEAIRSVLTQDRLPQVWLIVSDGSTDQTDQIVQRYASQYSFIRLIRRNKDQHRGFASKVFALRAGLKSVQNENAPFIAHLDADISLEPSYFRLILERFQEDPKLGIAGGWYVEKDSRGEYQLSPGSSSTSVPGCIQVFRRDCYEEIGGLLPIEYGGEDWYAEIMARKCGWRVKSFPDLLVRHLRETGTARNVLRYCYHQGFTDFSLGSHPLFELLKVARRVSWRPYLLGALARLSGFLVAHLYGKRMVPPDFVAFLRKEQIDRFRSDPSALSRS